MNLSEEEEAAGDQQPLTQTAPALLVARERRQGTKAPWLGGWQRSERPQSPPEFLSKAQFWFSSVDTEATLSQRRYKLETRPVETKHKRTAFIFTTCGSDYLVPGPAQLVLW